MARYDEIMKFRSILKSASPERRLYVHVIPNSPFVILVEKKEEEKRELEVKFDETCLADPVANYRSWSYQARPTSTPAVLQSGSPQARAGRGRVAAGNQKPHTRET
jgi:hypothetical protein